MINHSCLIQQLPTLLAWGVGELTQAITLDTLNIKYCSNKLFYCYCWWCLKLALVVVVVVWLFADYKYWLASSARCCKYGTLVTDSSINCIINEQFPLIVNRKYYRSSSLSVVHSLSLVISWEIILPLSLSLPGLKIVHISFQLIFLGNRT